MDLLPAGSTACRFLDFNRQFDLLPAGFWTFQTACWAAERRGPMAGGWFHSLLLRTDGYWYYLLLLLLLRLPTTTTTTTTTTTSTTFTTNTGSSLRSDGQASAFGRGDRGSFTSEVLYVNMISYDIVYYNRM